MKTDTRLGEFLGTCKLRKAFAVCGQETWRSGFDTVQQDGMTFIGVGPPQQQGRGSAGVSITLSHLAAAAWERTGRELHVDLGPRLMAIRLEVRCGGRGRAYHQKMSIFLVSSYAPDSSKPAAEHEAYYTGLAVLLARRRSGDVLIVGTDANAGIGRGPLGNSSGGGSGCAGAVGPHGLLHLNPAGRRLRSFLESHELCSLASFYPKRYYGTWIHPRSKLEHQLDHIFISQAHRCRIRDAGSCPFQLISSDHRAVGCKMRFTVSLQRKADPRRDLLRLDTSMLFTREGQQAFARCAMQHALPSYPVSGQTQIDSERPSLTHHDGARPASSHSLADPRDHDAAIFSAFTAQYGHGWWNHDPLSHLYYASLPLPQPQPPPSSTVSLGLHVADDGRVHLSLGIDAPPPPPSVPYPTLASALRAAATELLPRKPKPQPPWFEASEEKLRILIARRDSALNAHHRHPSTATAAARTRARAELKTGLRVARSSWAIDKSSQVNDGIVALRGTSTAWNLVSELRAGLGGSRRQAAPAKMKQRDGTLASTPEENAQVFADHFKGLYERVPTFDSSVLDLVKQREIAVGLDHKPTDKEIRMALGKLRDSGPGESGLVARLWKSLGTTEEGFALIRHMVHRFWESEEMDEEWETGLLKILPKKGDKSLPGNYRGIMLLEVAYKIVANLMHMRLQVISESVEHVDHEPQCGFRPGRGCSDASFTIKQLIKKRREHGHETWVLFVDLVKAFDRVPRCSESTIECNENDAARAALDEKLGMLWRVLLKFGVPPKLVRLLIAMHKKVLVKFDVDGVITTLLAIIGVKQGDLLGPPLFNFYIAAIMESWRATSDYELPTFRTRPDFKMTGRRPNTSGEEFTVGDSEYADDTGLAFCSREDVVEQTPKVTCHFRRWGMEIHEGILDPLVHSGLLDFEAMQVTKGSKSEVLFCSKPLHMYIDPSTYDGADLSPIMLPNLGYMEVVDRFPYLGDMVARDGGDALAVDARVEAGSRAFGALRSCLFTTTAISRAAKRAVYEAVVMSISLYGSECWSLTEGLRQRLRGMQAQHLRAMSRVSRTHTWRHHISTQQLGREMGLESTDHYVARRQLRFAGHVSRMDFERRLPRRMLSSWVPHARPSGAPTMTYGRSLGRAFEHYGLDPARWHELAAHRSRWRAMLQTGVAPAEFRPQPPPPPPPPLAKTKPSRRCAAQTMAAIDRMRTTDAALQQYLKPISR